MRLKYGSGPFNLWRDEHPDVAIVLDGARLDGMVLTGANLEEADLIMAQAQGATFSGANLRECDLLGANMTGARVSAADLAGALHVPPGSPER